MDSHQTTSTSCALWSSLQSGTGRRCPIAWEEDEVGEEEDDGERMTGERCGQRAHGGVLEQMAMKFQCVGEKTVFFSVLRQKNTFEECPVPNFGF